MRGKSGSVPDLAVGEDILRVGQRQLLDIALVRLYRVLPHVQRKVAVGASD